MHRTASPHRRKGWIPGSAVLIFALAAVVGDRPVLAQTEPPPCPAIDWQTEVVHMTADSLALEANGLLFTTEGVAIALASDPGDGEGWTLEAEWIEHDVEQRLYLYFDTDGHDWWVREVRVYDGTADSAWLAWRGPFFRTALGQAFEGEARLDGLTGGLTLTELHIEVSPRLPTGMDPSPPAGAISGAGDPSQAPRIVDDACDRQHAQVDRVSTITPR